MFLITVCSVCITDTNDPRTPDKVIDGVCATCDDTHAWLAPFVGGNAKVIVDDGEKEQEPNKVDDALSNAGDIPSDVSKPTSRDHERVCIADAAIGQPCNTLSVTLDRPSRLGMIRIWNYNKDRVHTARGARHVAICSTDGSADASPSTLFFGEIRRSTGHHTSCCLHAEPIMFTDDCDVLANIDAHDAQYLAALAALASAEEDRYDEGVSPVKIEEDNNSNDDDDDDDVDGGDHRSGEKI